MIDWGDARFLLLGLASLALLLALLVRARRKRRWALAELAGHELAPRLAASVDDRAVRWRTVLRVAGLVALVLAAGGPRWGRQVVRVSGQGSDLVLVFDVSQSMDSRDVPPSRLEEAKREAETLIDGLAGDRVGVVAFAGEGAVLSPLTLDYSALRLIVGSLQSGTVSHPGTDVGRGLRSALDLLPRSRPGEQAIVLFTDGEDLEGGAEAGGALAARRGVRVITVGVGTPGGQAIPIYDDQGRQIGLKKDEQGGVVLSRLDERLLREIARTTRGAYFSAAHPGGEVSRLRLAVSRVERGRREGRLGTRPVERFPLFAWFAWLTWVAAWLLPARRPRTALAAARGPAAGAIATLLAASLALAPVPAARAGALEDGNAALKRGDDAGAVQAYRLGLRRSPRDPRLLANLGYALYRSGDFAGSAGAFAEALSAGEGKLSPAQLAGVQYNRGNALFRQQEYGAAAESYRRSLERRPDDADARFNYEVALARAKSPPTPPQPPPSSGGSSGASGGGGTQGKPPPAPASQAPQPPQQQATAPHPERQAAAGQLSREAAQRILDALVQEEAQAQEHKARARVVTERRGRDW